MIIHVKYVDGSADELESNFKPSFEKGFVRILLKEGALTDIQNRTIKRITYNRIEEK